MTKHGTECAAVGAADQRWPDTRSDARGGSGPTTTRHAASDARQRLEQWLKWKLFRVRLKLEDRRSRAYDAAHHVETAREESLADCGVPQEDVARGNGVYRVTWGGLIRKAVSKLRIDHSRYTFIDYGAGKGKAMLMASDYPFKRIVGLEYSDRLQATAATNCSTYRSNSQKCRSLEAVLTDVLNYEPPPGPIVCFMCNPFDEATMQAVFDRWRARYEAGEKDILILYLNMRTVREMSSVLRTQNWLRPAAAGKRYVILAPSAESSRAATYRPPAWKMTLLAAELYGSASALYGGLSALCDALSC